MSDWRSLHPLDTGPQMFERDNVMVSIDYDGEVEVEIDARGYGTVHAHIPRAIIDQLFEAWAKQKAVEKERK